MAETTAAAVRRMLSEHKEGARFRIEKARAQVAAEERALEALILAEADIGTELRQIKERHAGASVCSARELRTFLGSNLCAEMEETLEAKHQGWPNALRDILERAAERLEDLEELEGVDHG